jgi:HD-GYP domain-containing protein (c-di-GMP phosphodiesterase class II)
VKPPRPVKQLDSTVNWAHIQRGRGGRLPPVRTASGVRLAELLATLSLVTDLGNGQPLEKALRGSLLAVRIGRELGLKEQDLSDAYYVAMLSGLGCTAFAHELSQAVGGDEIRMKAVFQAVDPGRPRELLASLLFHLAEDRPPLERAGVVLRMLARGRAFFELSVATDCEAAGRLAQRLGMSDGVRDGLAHLITRWDGKGVPAVAGEAIAINGRVGHFAYVAEILHRHVGRSALLEVIRGRRGEFDPAVVEAFLRIAPDVLAEIEPESVWDPALAAEPEPRTELPDSRLDDVARTFADFADLKSPFTLGHSTGVARLAEAAARHLNMADEAVTELHRAGLLHDLGRVSVPNGIWEKPGPLSAAEWERVRLHSYYTERVLAVSPAFHPIALLAGMHHERLNASGYHRGVPAAVIPVGARILAAADAYQAMSEERPHRIALAPPEAAANLNAEVKSGRLDREAVEAVLEAAGQPTSRLRVTWPGGLSDREVQVLRLVAKGKSDKHIGRVLFISEVTVHHHVRHIYDKIGLSTRAGAALFAMEHDLIQAEPSEK